MNIYKFIKIKTHSFHMVHNIQNNFFSCVFQIDLSKITVAMRIAVDICTCGV